MGRGRPPAPPPQVYTPKFTRAYEDTDTSEVWTYDLNKSSGPILVEIKYKNGLDKKWDKIQSDLKRTNREMRKINKIQGSKKKK